MAETMTETEKHELIRLARLAWPSHEITLVAAGDAVSIKLCPGTWMHDANICHPRAGEAMLAALRVLAGERPAADQSAAWLEAPKPTPECPDAYGLGVSVPEPPAAGEKVTLSWKIGKREPRVPVSELRKLAAEWRLDFGIYASDHARGREDQGAVCADELEALCGAADGGPRKDGENG